MERSAAHAAVNALPAPPAYRFKLIRPRAHCCRYAKTELFTTGNLWAAHPKGCELTCLQDPRCRVFAHTAKYGKCTFCTSCAKPHAGGTSRDYTSWEVQLVGEGDGAGTEWRRFEEARNGTYALGDPVWRPPERGSVARFERLREVFWMHVPKTGSSFTHTVFGHACGARNFSWQVNAHTDYPHDTCGGGRSFVQAHGPQHNFHEPIPWMDERTHRTSWKYKGIIPKQHRVPMPGMGNVVTMFRRPAQRLLSALAYIKANPKCCTADWGWGWSYTHGRHKDAVSAAVGPVQFARMRGITGCQTKMVLGFRCTSSIPTVRANLTEEDATVGASGIRRSELASAVEIVRRNLSFVGLQEHWDASICLWHARFGGSLHRAELLDSRPTAAQWNATSRIYKNNQQASSTRVTSVESEAAALEAAVAAAAELRSGLGAREEYNESLLIGVEDEADEAIYAAATERFWAEVETYKARVDACLRAVRRHKARTARFARAQAQSLDPASR